LRGQAELTFGPGGENSFQGAQLKKKIPMKGRFYFEVRVESDKASDGARWCAIGIASHRWNWYRFIDLGVFGLFADSRGFLLSVDSDGCGWWSSNDGSGWYAAGDVFCFDTKLGRRTSDIGTIDSGDTVGVLIDRDQGKQFFFKNGVVQKLVAADSRFTTLEDMYPTFIILQHGRITVLPKRSPPPFTEPTQVETPADDDEKPNDDDDDGSSSEES
jgi:hypothetical protein